MKIHEYQAKAILAQYHVPVPRGHVAYNLEEAEAAARALGGSVVVKAQIHAGGRGKGGGVKVAKDAVEALELARKLAFGIGIPAASVNAAAAAMAALSKAYWATDASLAEINPFILTKDGKVYALDAKITLDDNALYRHKELVELRDLNEEDPLEVEASRYGLNYIKLDGTVGCMVNGAGLAMATMDIIKFAGGSPANFLDVGGGASAEQVKNAFRILLSDHHVKAVLINIFGGILRCDTLASGVVGAARDLNIQVPIVVRMEGTNVELGRQILMDSGLNFTVGADMLDAAKKVVKLAAQ